MIYIQDAAEISPIFQKATGKKYNEVYFKNSVRPKCR